MTGSEVSTHSRPKAAASQLFKALSVKEVSTHSRPKAAAIFVIANIAIEKVSTHSRPKAAAHGLIQLKRRRRGFNTQPPEGGCLKRLMNKRKELVFQHTAARRRLPYKKALSGLDILVSTHSRPKAAAFLDCKIG